MARSSGLGHPLHKPVDPRTPRLFEIAAQSGLSGDDVKLVQLTGAEAERVSGKPLPINATGAICCEFGFPWRIVRGFGVRARAIGLVGLLAEEAERPMAFELWQRIEDEASANLRGEAQACPLRDSGGIGPRAADVKQIRSRG